MANSMSQYVQNGTTYIIDDPTIAPVFVESTAYSAGQYVKHQGNLYKLTADHAANTTWANTSKTQVLVESEMRTMQGATSELKSAFTQHKSEYVDFSMKVLNDLTLENDFIYGRYLSNGFANVSTYARNRVAYPAGKYEIGPYAARGFTAVEYISDTEGNPLLQTYVVQKVTITATRPWYISFNNITGDADIAAINAGMTVKRITTETNTLESRVETLGETIEPVLESFETVYSKNRYDGTYTDKGGYIIPTSGEIGSNQVYSPSGWVDISNHGNAAIVYSQFYNFANYAMRYALYDGNKQYISGELVDGATVMLDSSLSRYYVTIQAPATAKYMRFSMTAGAFTVTPVPGMQIEYTSPTAFAEYIEDQFTITDSAIEENAIIKGLMNGSGTGNSGIVESMTFGKKPPQNTASTFTDGNTLVVENNSVMKNQCISFVANISGSFDAVIVGHGRESYGYMIKVDATNMTYGSNGSWGTAVPHGLTIESFIGVIIEVDVELNIKTTIVSNGGYFTRSQQINSSWRGDVFATSDGTSFTDATLTWHTNDYKCPLWAFGDSYFTLYSPTRWPYYIANKWGFNNILLNAYPGENSERAYADLTNALTHGTPKYILWCMGMNDPDETSTPNATWLAKVQSLIDVCEQKGITPILTTIPIVTNTNYKNSYKNTWIRNSGVRYVDFAAALENVAGWLSDDNVHPSEIGGRYMALYLMAEVPEIMQGK